MRKKWSTLAFGFLVAAYAHIRIKEKRSVKSYMLEQGIRLSRAKRRFMYKEEAMKALEKMAPQTAGEYEGTNYQFKMPVKVDKHFGSTVIPLTINKISINALYYMHMEAHGSKTHSKFISNLLMNLQKHSMLKSSCQYIRRFRIKIIKRRMCFLKSCTMIY